MAAPPNKKKLESLSKTVQEEGEEDVVGQRRRYMPVTNLLFIMTSGSILAFVAAPITYVAFAATQRDVYGLRRWPLPLVTDMLKHWPVVSSATLGVGMTLLFTGLTATAIARIPLDVQFSPRTQLVRASAAAQICLWLLVSTSPDFEEGYVSYIHYASAIGLMIASIYALHQAHWACQYFLDVAEQLHQGAMQRSTPGTSAAMMLGSACVWLGTLGIVASVVSGCVIASGRSGGGESAAPPQWSFQLLVSGELMVLGFGGLGYFFIIYAYACVEDVARRATRKLYGR